MEFVGKKGHGGSGEFHKVDIDALERLMAPENEEVSPRYILKYSTRGGSNIFHLDTAEKQDHFVASRKRWLESQEGKGSTARTLVK